MPIAKRITRLCLFAALLCTALVGMAVQVGRRTAGNGAIAFTASRDGNLEIYLIDLGGLVQVNVTRSPTQDSNPNWSPQGEFIAFASLRDENWDIYTVNMTGNGLFRLTDAERFDIAPSWSPTGEFVAFEVWGDGAAASGNNICVLNIHEDNTHCIVPEPAFSTNPTWSPNGNEIAFISNPDGLAAIYFVQSDGNNFRQLADAEVYDSGGVAWSPDGTSIAFSASLIGETQIFIMDISTKNVRQLTYIPQSINSYPTWSPDSTQIAFMSSPFQGGTTSSLYIIRVDGTDLRLLTTDGMFPAWRPHP